MNGNRWAAPTPPGARNPAASHGGGLAADHGFAVFVEVRIGPALTETVEDVIVVLGSGREVASLADVLLHDVFVEFHAEAGRIGHRDVAAVHDGFGGTGDQVAHQGMS